MRLANLNGRATIMLSDRSGVDLATASEGRFGPHCSAVLENWDAFREWAARAKPGGPARDVPLEELHAPSPNPSQVFAIGLNYHEHARESGLDSPSDAPPVFTKFTSSLAGPFATVELPADGNTDWEVELVVVVGRTARRVAVEDAWSFVAGVTVGQDLSERKSQLAGPAPQFSLGKSFPGFAPTGPWLVTPDEFANPDDLKLGCRVDGVVVQKGRTRDLIFGVKELVSLLSQTVTLEPGDLIFTGTPAGVGLSRSPQRFLLPGEKLTSWVEGIGEIEQTFVADAEPVAHV